MRNVPRLQSIRHRCLPPYDHLLANQTRGGFDVLSLTLERRELGVQEDSDNRGAWHELSKQAYAFPFELVGPECPARRILGGPVHAFDEPRFDGITPHSEDDGD